jgi:menaquinone-dependent protoporphyrinogen oxidase
VEPATEGAIRVARVLVVYGSWAGSTAGVAHRVGKALIAQGATVTVVPAGSAPDPIAYDAVVVGSAVRSGQWHPSARAWLSGHASRLRGKPVALFSVCLTPVAHPTRDAEAQGYMMPLVVKTGIRPVSARAFAGIFDPAKLSLGDRTRARLWGATPGDFRDFAAIDSWALGLAPRFEG